MKWEGIYLRATAENFDDIVGTASDLDVGLELQMFALPASYNKGPESDLTRYSGGLRGFVGPITFHAPYIDISITSPDSYIRDYSLKMFDFAVETALSLGAQKLIIHSGYNPLIAFNRYKEEFAVNFVEVMCPFIERATEDDLIICVENIFEATPDIVFTIAETAASPHVKVCFDAGHANIFSSIGLNEWVKLLGDYIGYVHLHDNDGVYDTHLPPGEGSVDIDSVMTELAQLEKVPAIGLEVTAPIGKLNDIVSYLREYK